MPVYIISVFEILWVASLNWSVLAWYHVMMFACHYLYWNYFIFPPCFEFKNVSVTCKNYIWPKFISSNPTSYVPCRNFLTLFVQSLCMTLIYHLKFLCMVLGETRITASFDYYQKGLLLCKLIFVCLVPHIWGIWIIIRFNLAERHTVLFIYICR